MAPAQPHERALDLFGTEIVVREWGGSKGKTVVYWPGLNPFGALDLIEAGPAWSERYGFHVVSIAAPGCGESPTLGDKDAYRPTRLAKLVLDILDALELEGVAFVGFSWGGAVGAHLAVRAPQRVKALVLLDSGYNDPKTDPGYRQRSLAELEAELREQQGQFRFPSWDAFIGAVRSPTNWRGELEQRFRAGMKESDEEIVPRSDPEGAAAALYGIEAEPVSGIAVELTRTGVPVLLLASGRIVNEEPWANQALERFVLVLPSAHIEIVEGAGHDVLADDPTTIDLIGRWLEGHVK